MSHAMYVLPSDVPLRPEQPTKHNLPSPATPLIGRESQIEAARALLLRPEVRLVTMTGPPGVGKTRLGVQVACEMALSFSGGVCFVPLAPVTSPRTAFIAIAQTLGLKESGNKALHERVKEYLRGRQMLLLLDNLEQVVPAASLVSELLRTSPQIKVLVTSRTLLRVYGEHEFPVHPFPLPQAGHPSGVEGIARNEAVELFVQRARASKPDFQLTEENAGAVAEICARLDGLPLAIELAAARTKLLPPHAMLARLKGWGQRLNLLRDGAQDLPTRQQTLRNAIDWSYDLLDAEHQALLRRLAVFVGGFSLEGAEAVWGVPNDDRGRPISNSALHAPHSLDVLDGISSLVNKSLLRQDASGEREPRFRMLETIRDYALERLEESGEVEEIRLGHALYYVSLAERGEAVLLGKAQAGEEQHTTWLDRIESEHDNVRAALLWTSSECGVRSAERGIPDDDGGEAIPHSALRTPNSGDTHLGLRLVGALGMFWEMRGHLSEGREWAAAALASAGDRAKPYDRAKALLIMGKLALWQGAFEQSQRELEESVALWRELCDRWGISATLLGLGHLAMARRDYAQARSLIEESLNTRRELGYTVGVASALQGLGAVAMHEGDYEGALGLLEEGLMLARGMGHKWIMVRALNHVGHITLRGEDAVRGEAAFREAFTLAAEIGSKLGITRSLMGMVEVACVQGRWRQAARLIGTVDELLEATCVCMYPLDCEEYDRDRESASRMLGDAFDELRAEGRLMSPEEVVQAVYAGEHEAQRGGFTEHGPVLAIVPGGHELSARELEVLQLIAQGLTNDQIARKLVISSHTVNNHLRSIFRKLGVASRSAATRYAVVNKLV